MILDLTQTLVEGIPDWGGCCGFKMQMLDGDFGGFRIQELSFPNGIGTHMDAPSHLISDGLSIADISLDSLICPAAVIDVRHKVTDDYAISIDDINAYEARQGKILGGSIVIGYTGWGERWCCQEKYRNADDNGLMRFPVFSVEAVQLLLERGINGIAIDTLSPDAPGGLFPVHHALLGAGKFIIENIKMAPEMPPKGATIYALPLKIKSATEAPCRVIASLSA